MNVNSQKSNGTRPAVISGASEPAVFPNSLSLLPFIYATMFIQRNIFNEFTLQLRSDIKYDVIVVIRDFR